MYLSGDLYCSEFLNTRMVARRPMHTVMIVIIFILKIIHLKKKNPSKLKVEIIHLKKRILVN